MGEVPHPTATTGVVEVAGGRPPPPSPPTPRPRLRISAPDCSPAVVVPFLCLHPSACDSPGETGRGASACRNRRRRPDLRWSVSSSSASSPAAAL
ncbi:hypothetical protein PR202_gb24291 [Eleusine coracana subsp. coracana]|uniref:Uncharacterized protein n=1 Tax=Eleusine coracana subsp. coracana TaxID=191504 RepID=A0AAV5FKV1_ELECO|nr:hypothetical protein PR202_gb24291 [Eleusine coracana subsp. coracana]